MPSLNQIAEILAERVGRPFDIPFQDLVKPMIIAWSNRLTKNSLEKHMFDRKHFLVPILVKLEETRAIKCEDENCKILKSIDKVPKPIRVNNILFDYVGSSDYMTSYDLINEYEIGWLSGNRYTKNRIKYFYKNQHLYLYVSTNTILEDVAVDLIPADVSEVEKLCGEECYNDDMDFPIHPDLLQLLFSSILQTELRQLPIVESPEIDADKKSS